MRGPPSKWTCCVRRPLQRRGSPGDTQMWLTNKRAFHTVSGEGDYICVIYIWHSRCWLKANSILRYLPVSEALELLSGWHLAQPFNVFEGGKHLCCFRSIFVVLSKHKIWINLHMYGLTLTSLNDFTCWGHISYSLEPFLTSNRNEHAWTQVSFCRCSGFEEST